MKRKERYNDNCGMIWNHSRNRNAITSEHEQHRGDICSNIYFRLTLCGILLLLFSFPSSTLQSQITESFESWESLENGVSVPSGWSAFEFAVGKVEDSYSGDYAVSIWNWYSHVPGILAIGNGVARPQIDKMTGIPIDYVPDRLTGHYRFLEGQNFMVQKETDDSAAVFVVVSRWNSELQKRDTVALADWRLAPVEAWSQFTIPIKRIRTDLKPDSIIVAFFSSNPENVARCGPDSNTCCYLSLDELALVSTSGVLTPLLPAIPQVQVQPQPAVDRVTIQAENLSSPATSYELYSITGEIVRTGPIGSDSRFQIVTATLPSGHYLLTLKDAESEVVGRERIVVGR